MQDLSVASDRASAAAEGPLVSVLMTVHSVDPRLLRCSLASILHQTFSDFELLIVVDGNVGAADTILGTASCDPRVRILRPGRVGRGVALNLGLAAAAGEYIAIHDSDDESHPRRLECQVRAFARHPEIDLLGADAVVVRSLSAHASWRVEKEPHGVRIIDRELITRNVFTHTSVMARSSLFDELGGYDVGRRRFFDYDLYLRARDRGLCLAKLDAPLVLFRFHRQQWFGSEKAVLARMREAAELQRSHVTDMPFLRRQWWTAMIALRVGARFGRAQLVRKLMERMSPV